MKIFFWIIFLIFFLLVRTVLAESIVEELTQLNNLYKEGAISKEEFYNAKTILLKSKSEEKLIETEKKKENNKIKKVKKDKQEVIEKEKNKNNKTTELKNFEEDLSKTYISFTEINELGTYKKIEKIPDGMFKIKMSPKQTAKNAMVKMYNTFVKTPKLMEKYPENMMKAMGYFEIFYNQQLEDKKKSIKKFKENYPNINWITKKDIKTLYSLNNAKKSMRESLGLTLDNDLEEALERYMLMYNFLKPAEKIQHKLSSKEKKLKKASSKFKKNYGNFKKTLELKSEKRIDNKNFHKDLKKNIKSVKKSIKTLTNLDPKTDKLYLVVSDNFEKSLEILNDCNQNCTRKDILIVIDTIKFNNQILKEAEANLIKKQYSQNMENMNMDNFSNEQQASIALVSSKLKIKKRNDYKELQESVLNLETNGFNITESLDNLEKNGFEIKSITMSFDTLDNMKRWVMKDWAKSWRGELPKDITDNSGNLIEFTEENIQDLKAQLAINSFKSMIDAPELRETVNESIQDISQEIIESGGFDVDDWLNQDFSITLNNYSQLVGNSLGIDLENFNDLTKVVNEWSGSDMTSDEYAKHWETSQYLDSTSNWGDVTMGVDLINQVGSFDAASIAKDLGTDLQTVADSIYAAANVGISTDLEAAAQGLGYSSFADAVAAYNAEYGTNYTEDEAKEALGQ